MHQDFINGLITSLHIDLIVEQFYNNIRFRLLLFRIIKYNIVMYLIPFIIGYFLEYWFGVLLTGLLNILMYPINIFSAVFHLLHYVDLINIISVKVFKISTNNQDVLDLMSVSILMFIYQFVIFLTTHVINLIFGEYYFVAFLLNLFTLSIYHSFYCFNNLWHYQKIKIAYRIDMYEKMWPYYIGYGTIATFLYLCIKNPIVLFLYNLYMTFIVSIPFIINPLYPKKNMPYPKINLKIFTYAIQFIFILAKKISKTISE